jgi:hypothetical protein
MHPLNPILTLCADNLTTTIVEGDSAQYLSPYYESIDIHYSTKLIEKKLCQELYLLVNVPGLIGRSYEEVYNWYTDDILKILLVVYQCREQ